MKVNDLHFSFLPQELIAQTAIEPRDHSKLLVYDKTNDKIEDKKASIIS